MNYETKELSEFNKKINKGELTISSVGQWIVQGKKNMARKSICVEIHQEKKSEKIAVKMDAVNRAGDGEKPSRVDNKKFMY